MKYIDTDKLIAEIERRIAAYQKNFDKADNKIAKLSTDGRIASLKGILPFITSLQQEQPEVECDDLEEVARAYSEQVTDGHNYRDLTCGFKAGAEWQKRQMLKDAVEGEAEELYNDGESQCTVGVGTYFKPGEKVYVLKAEENKK